MAKIQAIREKYKHLEDKVEPLKAPAMLPKAFIARRCTVL